MTPINTHAYFFGSNGCLNLQGYRSVIAGELSGAVLDQVNAHLESCELCQEALEGLRKTPNDFTVAAGVKTLVKKINNPATPNRVLYYAISAAAVILFAVGLGYQAFKGQEEKEMDKAFATEFKPYPPPEGVESKKLESGFAEAEKSIADKKTAEDIPQKEMPVISEGKIKQLEKTGDYDNAKDFRPATDKSEVLSKNIELDDVTISESVPEEQKTYSAPLSTGTIHPTAPQNIQNEAVTITGQAQGKKIQDQEVSSYESNRLESVSIISASKKNQKVSKEKNNVKSTPQSAADEQPGYLLRERNMMPDTVVLSQMAMDKYRSEEYAKAAKLFDDILAADPMRYDARFYGGVSWLESGNTKKAESYFRNLISTSGHTYGYTSKWYLALTLIKEKNKTPALALLEELAGIPGEFQQRAKDLAETLK